MGLRNGEVFPQMRNGTWTQLSNVHVCFTAKVLSYRKFHTLTYWEYNQSYCNNIFTFNLWVELWWTAKFFQPVSFDIYFLGSKPASGLKFYLTVLFLFSFSFSFNKIEKPNWFKFFHPKTSLNQNINLPSSNSELSYLGCNYQIMTTQLTQKNLQRVTSTMQKGRDLEPCFKISLEGIFR